MGAPSADALGAPRPQRPSRKLLALLIRECQDVSSLAAKLRVDVNRASALVSGGCSVTPAEELAIDRL